MNDRKVNQYNQQEKKKEGLANKVKKVKKKEKKNFVDYVEIHSLYFFLSFSLTLLLSHSRSLTHFPTLLVFFLLVSPHNLKLTGGREGQKKKFVT